MPVVRPSTVPLGQVWLRFTGRERNGVPAKNYIVKDMDEKHRNQCIDLMLETFLRDEPLCRVFDIQSDPASVATIKQNWEEILDQKISLAVYVEEEGREELVGFNILMVKSLNDPEEDLDNVKGESWKKLLQTLIAAEKTVDVFKKYNVDAYLSSSGMTVKVEHRGQNIGAKMMEARKPLCKALGLQAIATVFTAKTSQTLAAKSGYELLGTLLYKDMIHQGILITGCDNPTAEVRGVKFIF